MPKITRLKFQKNQERVNLYLDGKYAFGVDAQKVLAKNLKVGQEISSKEQEELKDSGDLAKYFDKTLRFVSSRPHSQREITDYLFRKKVPPEMVSQITEKLISLGLVNDHDFAVWWVEQRTAFRPKGTRALRAELRGKGVSTEIVDEALKGVNEVPLALQAARKKNLDREKLVGYLGRKGFSWDTIESVLEEIGKKE